LLLVALLLCCFFAALLLCSFAVCSSLQQFAAVCSAVYSFSQKKLSQSAEMTWTQLAYISESFSRVITISLYLLSHTTKRLGMTDAFRPWPFLAKYIGEDGFTPP